MEKIYWRLHKSIYWNILIYWEGHVCACRFIQVTLIGIVSYTNVSRACMTSYDRPECRDVSITTPATAVSSHCWLPKCEPQHHNPSFGCEQSNIRFYAVILVLYTIKLLFETKYWKSIDIYCAFAHPYFNILSILRVRMFHIQYQYFRGMQLQINNLFDMP